MNLHPTIASQIAAYRIAEWHQQAAGQSLARQLRAGGAASPGNGRVRAGWARLGSRHPRPAAA
jgi:hypothetical protein